MSKSRGTRWALAMLTIVMLLWAGNAIVGRAVRYDIPPFTLAFARWIGALCIVLPLAAQHLRNDWIVLKTYWRVIVLFGTVGIAGFNGFLYSGLRLTTAANALLLQAAIPSLVFLFDFWLFKKRPAFWQIVGVTLSTVGVGVVITHADLHALANFRFGAGDIIVLCGVLCWAVYTACLRLRPAVQPMSFLAATFVIGAVAMFPLALTEWREAAAVQWRPALIGAVAYVAIFPSVVAYGLYNAAVAEIGPGRAGQAISLMPLFGAGLAALLLREPLHGYHLTGMALILGGIAVTALLSAKDPARANI